MSVVKTSNISPLGTFTDRVVAAANIEFKAVEGVGNERSMKDTGCKLKQQMKASGESYKQEQQAKV